jgi:N-acetylglutamate synthase-like GNAT family acetyltransferase
MTFIIKRPAKNDAHAILECHRDAILAKAGNSYNEDVIKSWARTINEDKICKVEDEIQNLEWIYFVAESDEGIIGFGIITPENNELRAIYVRPCKESDVGRSIMNKLLEEARLKDLSFLKMDASLNAELFYKKFGFRNLGRGFHTFESGAKMDCIKMRLDVKPSTTGS